MTTLPGMVFLIKREGEDGKIGPLKDALQVAIGSPIADEYLTNRGYYAGAAEEYEQFMAEHGNEDAVAGDVNSDGVRDSEDKEIIEDIQEENADMPPETVEEVVPETPAE